MSETAIEMQRDLNTCFIDYRKGFDKVEHKELKILECFDLIGKDIWFLLNSYWEQTTCIQIGNGKGDFVQIQRGVQQGFVFLPVLFNIDSEMILRGLEAMDEFTVSGHDFNNLWYAEDT